MNNKQLKITEVQVDCSNLTKEQIQRMVDIVVKNGYSIWDHRIALLVMDTSTFFRTYPADGEFGVYERRSYFTEITFDQFIDLFDAQSSEKELTIQEINQEIERLQALKKEKESDVVGKWCFVWDLDNKKSLFDRVMVINPNDPYPFETVSSAWMNAKPIPEPLQSQLEAEYQKLVRT